MHHHFLNCCHALGHISGACRRCWRCCVTLDNSTYLRISSGPTPSVAPGCRGLAAIVTAVSQRTKIPLFFCHCAHLTNKVTPPPVSLGKSFRHTWVRAPCTQEFSRASNLLCRESEDSWTPDEKDDNHWQNKSLTNFSWVWTCWFIPPEEQTSEAQQTKHYLHQRRRQQQQPHSVTLAAVSGSELMRGNAQCGPAVPLRPKPGSYNGPLKKGGLCPMQHEQVPL